MGDNWLESSIREDIILSPLLSTAAIGLEKK